MTDADNGDLHTHVMPFRALAAIWVALMVLTVLTALASQIDLGPLNLWIAMGIATLKALLVALFFMHLIYDRGFNAFVFCGALVFVFLFIGLTTLDAVQYNPDKIPDFAPGLR